MLCCGGTKVAKSVPSCPFYPRLLIDGQQSRLSDTSGLRQEDDVIQIHAVPQTAEAHTDSSDLSLSVDDAQSPLVMLAGPRLTLQPVQKLPRAADVPKLGNYSYEKAKKMIEQARFQRYLQQDQE